MSSIVFHQHESAFIGGPPNFRNPHKPVIPMDILREEVTASALRFEDVRVGQHYETSEIYTSAILGAFARLSGDYSPIHVDPDAAAEHGFSGRLVYGFLMASLLSQIVGKRFRSAVCVSVSIDFVNPVLLGDEVQASTDVVQVQKALRSVVLSVRFTRGGEIVSRGKLIVQFL